MSLVIVNRDFTIRTIISPQNRRNNGRILAQCRNSKIPLCCFFFLSLFLKIIMIGSKSQRIFRCTLRLNWCQLLLDITLVFLKKKDISWVWHFSNSDKSVQASMNHTSSPIDHIKLWFKVRIKFASKCLFFCLLGILRPLHHNATKQFHVTKQSSIVVEFNRPIIVDIITSFYHYLDTVFKYAHHIHFKQFTHTHNATQIHVTERQSHSYQEVYQHSNTVFWFRFLFCTSEEK